MSTTTTQRKGSDWLPVWDPEAADWDSGRAWKTLWVTTYALTLAFITWFLASAIAPKLNSIGFDLSQGQLYWLIAMPGLAGGTLRLIWTFLPPIMGTRKLVTLTTALFLIPLIGWALAVQNPDTPYAVLMLLGILAGIGGGAFSGFMPSTSYFFPRSKQGTALGVQAGIGNFGVSIVQFVTPWIIGIAIIGGSQMMTNKDTGATKEVWYQNAGYLWVPFVIVAVILAWFLLRSVPVQARGFKDQLDIFQNKHTWIMTYLYVITFGTFSGLAAGFALLINNLYGTKVFGDAGIDPVKYAFLGALVGSVARVISGPIADRVGGGRMTVVRHRGNLAGIALHDLPALPHVSRPVPAVPLRDARHLLLRRSRQRQHLQADAHDLRTPTGRRSDRLDLSDRRLRPLHLRRDARLHLPDSVLRTRSRVRAHRRRHLLVVLRTPGRREAVLTPAPRVPSGLESVA